MRAHGSIAWKDPTAACFEGKVVHTWHFTHQLCGIDSADVLGGGAGSAFAILHTIPPLPSASGSSTETEGAEVP
eukprot:CAMPEP_0194779528 /NCGR_PEP_ID=MMETSP0323_2-20130528/71273_1 /TAXON_ID=2866 ORGANISM="Crypthecodinium cohnii, Strain Seligo" /NCGR_SAMPLE_ID=MMETSP0323_2 /ASSEMBLY_ACC=CAM_ASM_000346 /LENGTH=73 /DNA_ID=CAMNT_0039717205 /DNA_START=179 /DNA_END=400 /DNA_ORIENTATION=+